MRNVTIVNESGLYDAILDSRKPQAKQFRRWITSDVIPAIRKHGGYLTPEATEKALDLFADSDDHGLKACRQAELHRLKDRPFEIFRSTRCPTGIENLCKPRPRGMSERAAHDT